MNLTVYLPPPPLCAATGAWPLATRLPPKVATWLLTCAAVALAAISTAVLAIFALTAVLRIPLVMSLAHLSAEVIRREDPASLAAALAAAVLLAAAIAAAAHVGWRRARALVSAARRARCLPGTSQVVVIPDVADAYTAPGRPGRIVVTAGMWPGAAPGRGSARPAPSVRPWLVAAAAAAVLVSGIAALDTAFDLHALVELAQAPVFLARSRTTPWSRSGRRRSTRWHRAPSGDSARSMGKASPPHKRSRTPEGTPPLRSSIRHVCGVACIAVTPVRWISDRSRSDSRTSWKVAITRSAPQTRGSSSRAAGKLGSSGT